MHRGSVEFVGHEGVHLRGDAFGDPTHPPVILLPGGGQTRHSWGGTAKRLAADGWYALSMDLRGHGESDWPESKDYSLDTFVADLLAMTSQLKQQPALVGASLGGLTSLLAAGERAPQAFAALVLVDIAPRMEMKGVERIITFMHQHLDGFADLDEAAAAIGEYMPHRPRPKDVAGLKKNLRLCDDGRYRWHWDPDFVLGKKGPSATMQTDRLLRAASQLTVPALLVRGKLSDVISEQSAHEFLAAAPQARFVDISEAGHMVVGDKNDIFAQAVIDFLRTVRAL